MGRLIIKRDSGWADKARKYRISVNNESIGMINEGEVLTRDLVPGKYYIKADLDWAKTSPFEINIKGDEQIAIKVFSNLRGIKLIFALFYCLIATFLPNIWIRIKMDR